MNHNEKQVSSTFISAKSSLDIYAPLNINGGGFDDVEGEVIALFQSGELIPDELIEAILTNNSL